MKNLLPEDTAPKQEDDWWKSVKIDIRDGLLATELTPPRVRADSASGSRSPTACRASRGRRRVEWSRYLNAASTPAQKSTGQAPDRIDTPKNGAHVGQIVEITRQGR